MKINRILTALVLSAVVLALSLFASLSYRLDENKVLEYSLLSNLTDISWLPASSLAELPSSQIAGDDPNNSSGNEILLLV